MGLKLELPIYISRSPHLQDVLPENFKINETLGWSIVADALVFSFGSAVGFLEVCGVVGAAFAALTARGGELHLAEGA